MSFMHEEYMVKNSTITGEFENSKWLYDGECNLVVCPTPLPYLAACTAVNLANNHCKEVKDFLSCLYGSERVYDNYHA